MIVRNPVMRTADGQLVYEATEGDLSKQVKLRHAEREVRLAQDPFPLYPGEELLQGVTELEIVRADTALRLRAARDFEDGETRRVAGDEWLFVGPGTYVPRVEVTVEETIHASVIGPNQALHVRARKETLDWQGQRRVTGEEWLVKQVGAYLPGVFEDVIGICDAHILTDKVALHLRASKTFKDETTKPPVQRRTGEEWLVKFTDTESYIPSVYEEVVKLVNITTLSNRQYAVIVNPVDEDGHNQLGKKKLVKGPSSFFLMPGEELENGIQNVYVLGEDEGIILRACETFTDGQTQRTPGDRWMLRGPAEYVPPVEVEVVNTRRAIPLDDNEGIYVRDTRSGKVRAVCGQSYMLNQNEELWAKELPPQIEQLLAASRDPLADRSERGSGSKSGAARDRTRVVTFRVPHNAAVQIYDYKAKQARVVFGPDLVMLGPDEQFTMLSLSGGKPKRPNEIKALCLLLGPDFCTDMLTIETSDHARLQLQLSYNWEFEVDKTNQAEAAKLFAVPDFVGDMCKAIASRVRGAVAGVRFDDFHKNSARIIRASVFGVDPTTEKVRDRFHFPSNNLVITAIDVQSAEPVDQRTRDALQKSVQLAIEITTNSQEAAARHDAQRLEQEARGHLERQKIEDEAKAEDARKALLELQANSAAVESTGQAKAEAQSRAEAARIEGEAAVKQAQLKAEAMEIAAKSELERLQAAREAELHYIESQNKLELDKAKQSAEIEIHKFQRMVEAIKPETLIAMAQAGPEMQAKLLQGLGIKSTLITDGKSPINLFQTANGLVAPPNGN